MLSYASLALGLVSRRSKVANMAGAIVGTAGGLATRFALFHVGKASARDPRATFDLQRRPDERGQPLGVRRDAKL